MNGEQRTALIRLMNEGLQSAGEAFKTGETLVWEQCASAEEEEAALKKVQDAYLDRVVAIAANIVTLRSYDH